MFQEYNNTIIIDKPLYITIQRDNLESFQEMTTIDDSQNDELLSKNVSPKSYEFKDAILKDFPPLLCVCAFFKAIKIVNYLLMNDIDPKAIDKKGRSSAHFAAAGGNLQILLMLNEFWIDFKEEDYRIFI